MRNSGVTLIELIIVIAIIGTLAGLVGVNYFGVRSRTVFENQLNGIAADLNWARSRSIAQENNSQWGIRFTNPAGDGNDYYEIWYGDSYSSDFTAGRRNLHGSVAFSDPPSGMATTTKDVIFLQSTGLPTSTSTIEFFSLTGPSTGTISVGGQGVIDINFN